MFQKRPTLTLAMIVKDEAANLPKSLAPVKGCFDEIVVVDTGSRDGTQELARSYGARVVPMSWRDDFAEARNASIDASKGDWILWLDGDNAVAPEGVGWLRRQLPRSRDVVFLMIEVVVPQKERLFQKRVFPKRKDVYFEGRVHEQLVHPGSFRQVQTEIEILHWGYRDKAAARQKGIRNLSLLEAMARERPPDFYVSYQLAKTLFNLRQFEESHVWLERAEMLFGRSTHPPSQYLDALVLKARAEDRVGRHEEAVSALKKILALAPDYGPARFYLGRILYFERRYEPAAEQFVAFLSLRTGDQGTGVDRENLWFMASLLLGRCLQILSRLEEASEAFREAMTMDPRHPEPLSGLAEVELQRERRDAARDYIDQCLTLRPNDPRALLLQQRL